VLPGRLAADRFDDLLGFALRLEAAGAEALLLSAIEIEGIAIDPFAIAASLGTAGCDMLLGVEIDAEDRSRPATLVGRELITLERVLGRAALGVRGAHASALRDIVERMIQPGRVVNNASDDLEVQGASFDFENVPKPTAGAILTILIDGSEAVLEPDQLLSLDLPEVADGVVLRRQGSDWIAIPAGA
jgi:hypothetical protein